MNPLHKPFVYLPAQMGHCAICHGSKVCAVADDELQRTVCSDCFPFVLMADAVLEGVPGVSRPVPGTLLRQ
jgi:hypothetical protein